MTRPALLHIGLPKTGTTTLQAHLFARHPGFHNVGRPLPNDVSDPRVRLTAALKYHDSLNYDAGGTARLARELLAGAGDRIPVLSDEGLSAEGVADRGLVAGRLGELFPGARVVVVLRSQPAMLASMYVQRLRGSEQRGDFTDLESWLEDAWRRWDTMRTGPLARLHYDALLAAYEDRFGADHVHPILFEDFVADPPRAAAQVCRLAGVDPEAGAELVRGQHENERMTERHLGYLRLRDALPHLPYGKLLPAPVKAAVKARLARGAKGRAHLPDAWKARLEELYAEGNQRLAKRHDLSLRDRGYPL